MRTEAVLHDAGLARLWAALVAESGALDVRTSRAAPTRTARVRRLPTCDRAVDADVHDGWRRTAG